LVIAIHRLLVPIVKGNTRLVSLIITILVSYSMLFAANRAVGRVCRGLPDAAFASRYSTLLIPAYLGIYFLLLLLPATNIRKIALGFLLAVLIRWRSYPEFSRPQVGRWQTCLGRVLPSNWRHRVLRPDHGFSYLTASGAKRDAAKIRLSEAAPAEFLLLDKV